MLRKFIANHSIAKRTVRFYFMHTLYNIISLNGLAEKQVKVPLFCIDYERMK